MKASSLAKAEIAARMVLFHNYDDTDAKTIISLWKIKLGGGQVKAIRRMRKMASLCRQQAAYNPAQSWRLLAEAEYWERLAQAETSSHFKDCHTTSSSTELAG
jgi:hypothetical protein